MAEYVRTQHHINIHLHPQMLKLSMNYFPVMAFVSSAAVYIISCAWVDCLQQL